MNEAIQQIVERVWVNQIGVPPEWSDQDAEEFFQTEADRLSPRRSPPGQWPHWSHGSSRSPTS